MCHTLCDTSGRVCGLRGISQQQQPSPSAAVGAAAGEADGSEGGAVAGQGGTAAAAVEGVLDDDELDAIDELTAALMELSTGLEGVPGQGGPSASQL